MFIRLCNPLKKRSFFLFGARGVGKTHLLRQLFSKEATLWIDLLRDEESIALTRDPGRLERQIIDRTKSTNGPIWVVLDEVQRVPTLLNEVHRLIEDPKIGSLIKFALTGSSACWYCAISGEKAIRSPTTK